jgi:hypothetical protein
MSRCPRLLSGKLYLSSQAIPAPLNTYSTLPSIESEDALMTSGIDAPDFQRICAIFD